MKKPTQIKSKNKTKFQVKKNLLNATKIVLRIVDFYQPPFQKKTVLFLLKYQINCHFDRRLHLYCSVSFLPFVLLSRSSFVTSFLAEFFLFYFITSFSTFAGAQFKD